MDADLKIHDLIVKVPGRGNLKVQGRVNAAERVVLRGPSGCGKSTLLRILSGLERPVSGKVQMGTKIISQVRPQDSGVGLVFQSGALFPHLNVLENVLFGLRHGRRFQAWGESLRQEKALAFLTKVNMEKMAARQVSTLSGGERQRIALLRTLICEPEVLLLDEPLSAVDPELRSALQEWILLIVAERPVPTLIVTHDLPEARRLSTRVVDWPRTANKEGIFCLEF